MKRAVTAICCLALACNSPADTGKKQSKPDSVVMIPTDTMIHITDTTVIPALIESWKTFEKYNGKYAADVKLLDQKPLRQRLSEMLEKEEADFEARFKVSPPVEIESGILFNEGCQPHNCGVEEAAIAIDMKKDVIYIGIARKKAVKLYGEKGDTAYPEKLLRWMMKFEE